MSTLFPVKKVNLVEEDEWKKDYDPAGRILEWAWQSAIDALEHEVRWPRGSCPDYVADLAPKLDRDEIERVCEGLEDRDDRLAQTEMAIQDALQWAFELAYMPGDGDIEDALESAFDEVRNNLYFRDEVVEGTMQWMGIEEERLVNDLLKHVRYEHPTHRGHPTYDRYIVFDFGKSNLLKSLIKGPFSVKREAPLGPKEWSPSKFMPATKEEQAAAREDVVRSVEELQDDIMLFFWKALAKEMERADIFNRLEVGPQWKSILKDRPRVRGIRKEIRDFLEAVEVDS